MNELCRKIYVEIHDLMDDAEKNKTISTEDLLELVEQVMDDAKSRRDGYRDDLKRPGR